MIKNCKVSIVPNEFAVTFMKKPVYERILNKGETHDRIIQQFCNDYHIAILFLDCCNYIIDMAQNGHLVENEEISLLFYGIPEQLTPNQWQFLMQKKDKIEESEVFVYHFIKQNQKQQLQQVYNLNQIYSSNKQMLEAVIFQKKLRDR